MRASILTIGYRCFSNLNAAINEVPVVTMSSTSKILQGTDILLGIFPQVSGLIYFLNLTRVIDFISKGVLGELNEINRLISSCKAERSDDRMGKL